MRTTSVLVLLPGLAVAQQAPLLDQAQSLFTQATEVIKSYMPATPTHSIPNPIPAVASVLAAGVINPLTLENYHQVLKAGASTSSPGIDEWMVLVTGGNKSCHGLCQHTEVEWNKSSAVLSASTSAPHLGLLNCEAQPILCGAWAVGPPSIMHLLLPHPNKQQSQPTATVRYIPLNRTSITANEIAEIHTAEKYKETKIYEGVWHPDGPLAKTGLNVPIGYVVWAMSLVPSWLMMVVISMGSRTLM